MKKTVRNANRGDSFRKKPSIPKKKVSGDSVPTKDSVTTNKDTAVVEGISASELLKHIKSVNHPLRVNELLTRLMLPRQKRKSLILALSALQANGDIVSLPGERWMLASRAQYAVGTFLVQRSGATFVAIEGKDDGAKADIFIPPGLQGGAWHNDSVRVIIQEGVRRGKNLEGRVIEILNRPAKDFVVSVGRKYSGNMVEGKPVDPRVQVRFSVDISSLANVPEEGDLLLIVPGEKIEKDLYAGALKLVLGSTEDARVQEKVVKVNHGIPLEFPLQVLEEGDSVDKAFTKNLDNILKGNPTPDIISKDSTHIRQDLRSIDFVTIDGEDARDFDDAICVYPKQNGWELWIAIADVSFFVKAGSALDSEALARANSYYFPTSVEPMLPEVLSNGLCSLRPDEERMVMATKITCNMHGEVVGAIFFPGVIRSRARLTYDQVHTALEFSDVSALPGGIESLSMLEDAAALAKAMRALRLRRGSLEFDLPEPRFIVDRSLGTIVGVAHREVLFSHQLIEEFMITANEAVARFLSEKEEPCLYRIHPEPDQERLEKLFRILLTTNLSQKLSNKLDAKCLKSYLEQAEETPQAFLISRMILRAMMQAKYTPEKGGHFGLASTAYCHFTSPIRRYADLVVHRALKHALGDGQFQRYAPKALESIAEQCNSRERASQDAEREIAKRLSCLVLQGREGEVFEAIITSITDFGFFIELDTMPVEGIVRVASLKQDWFEYNQDRQELLGTRTGVRFSLGQKVMVKLFSVNLMRVEIEFHLEDTGQNGASQKPKRALQGARRRNNTRFRGKGKKAT